MLNTLHTARSIQTTYRVNSILYGLKQVPGLKQLLPERLYQVRGLKLLALVLSLLWGFVSLFLGKALYFLVMLRLPLGFYGPVAEGRLYLHFLVLLTAAGVFFNTCFAQPSYQQYYAVSLLRMNPKRYTLVTFGWELVRLAVGFLPFSLLFGQISGLPLWFCLLFPLCVAGGKLFAAALELRAFRLRDSVLRKITWLQTGAAVILLALAYGLPAAGVMLPERLSMALLLALIPLGLWAVPVLLRFDSYRQLIRQVLADFFSSSEAISGSVQTSTHALISEGGAVSDSKKGFEYLNALFIRRHRKLLWRPTLLVSGICAAAAGAALLVLWMLPGARPGARELILRSLTYWPFLLYFISRGAGFTQALFINCDHSLLTYSFFKQPAAILALFRIRLREICKLNMVPGLIVGLGLDLLLLASGGAEPLTYLVLPAALVSISLFFAIHYLTLYYLLQPYNAGTQVKSGLYQFITGATYFVCYMLTQVRLSIPVFGLGCIAFFLAYSVLACVLVYRVAPKTFRIRP